MEDKGYCYEKFRQFKRKQNLDSIHLGCSGNFCQFCNSDYVLFPYH